MKRISNKEFFRILAECGVETDNAHLLNELVLFHRHQAVENQRCNCFYSAERLNEIADKLYLELDRRGFYDDVLKG